MDVSVEWIPLRDSLNRLSDESIPAITVCYEYIFEKFLFDEELKKYFNHYFEYDFIRKWIDFKLNYISDNFTSHDDHVKDIIKFYRINIVRFDNENKITKYQINFIKNLTYYLDVENKSEFIEKQKHLNDKTLNDLNGTQTQFDFFSFITLAIPYYHYDQFEYNKSLLPLKLMSPFGKCFTYLA